MTRIVYVVLALGLLAGPGLAAPPPRVTLADTYAGHAVLSAYWVSEKYDGVRGYWDGERLLTRGGTVIHAPQWFTADWPDTAMDGELWTGYHEFARVSGIVRSEAPADSDWDTVTYRVFDLPEHGGTFDARVPAIGAIVARIDQPWVVAIGQSHVADRAALRHRLAEVRAHGGEGLVLHRGSAPYHAGRSDDLLKVKPYRDAEARVVAIHPGAGRLQGLMGSLEVRMPDGRTFAIGSGFTDAQRADPPPVGSWISFRYQGHTATGLPRFARFLHRRPGGPPPEVGAAPGTR